MDGPDSLAHPVPGVVQAAGLHSATRPMQKKESEVLSTKQEKPRVLSPPSAFTLPVDCGVRVRPGYLLSHLLNV